MLRNRTVPGDWVWQLNVRDQLVNLAGQGPRPAGIESVRLIAASICGSILPATFPVRSVDLGER